MAPICGPILGGYISDSWNWGWIFLINVPVGLVVAALCWSNLAARESATRKLPIDTVGLGLLVVWAGALQVMLDTGKNADWFGSTQIIVLALVAVAGFIAFLLWELTEEHPILDLSLFRERNFTLGTIVFCLGNGVFLANMLLIPLWLQTQLGYTATWAGLVSAPTGVIAVLMTPLAARLMTPLRCQVGRHHRLRRFGRVLFHARQPDGGCQLHGHRHTADGAGHFLRLLSSSPPSPSCWTACRRKKSRRLQPVEFRAHHRGGIFRLPGHHLLGPARGAAPKPAGRHDLGLRAGLQQCAADRCRTWACRSWPPRRR